jgi:hypothetical protein
VQVEEGLVVTTVVEESGAPPALVAAAVVEEGQTVTETTALQAALEPPAEADAGGEDVVMVPADVGLAPPPSGGLGAATSMAHESSTVAGIASVEDTAD